MVVPQSIKVSLSIIDSGTWAPTWEPYNTKKMDVKRRMAVVLFSEWDNAKDEPRYTKYLEYSRGKGMEWWRSKVKEGVVKNITSWADNTGHIILWAEFDSIDSVGKLWKDEGFHNTNREFAPLVDNMKTRLMRITK